MGRHEQIQGHRVYRTCLHELLPLPPLELHVTVAILLLCIVGLYCPSRRSLPEGFLDLGQQAQLSRLILRHLKSAWLPVKDHNHDFRAPLPSLSQETVKRH